MAPFADAMRFVDGNSRKLALFVYYTKQIAESIQSTLLGSDIEQLDARMATA
jgi:hypothetical protein